ncbi:MAG: hypothetical protein HQL73_06045 [Magnetococcales bacterium]|nr:hypothetical protein [Magnetococcales bacterium]
MLDELEEDAIKEMFNLSLGHALPTLSEMIDAEIEFSTPCLEVTPTRELIQYLEGLVGESACVVHMAFDLLLTQRGRLLGNTLLLLRTEVLSPFLDALYGEHVPETLQGAVCEDAFTDVADLLLYTCISTLSRLLDSEVEGKKSIFYRGDPKTWDGILSSCRQYPATKAYEGTRKDDKSINLRIDFSVPVKNVSGSVLIWINATDDSDLKLAVRQFITTQAC